MVNDRVSSKILAVALTGGLLFSATTVSAAGNEYGLAYDNVAKTNEINKVMALTNKEALRLFTEAQASYLYIMKGGEGETETYTFTKNGITYRYMAESLSTMKKLKTYLGQIYTTQQANALIKKLGIIDQRGFLAQPDADGGSRLNFGKATLRETSATATAKKFTLSVPLDDTKEVETLQGELRYVKNSGWRVYSLETVLNGDTPPKMTTQQARALFTEAHTSYWHVVMGGDGQRNKETFKHKGKTYRYMAESLNTMTKLKNYLSATYTASQQTKLIKQLGIIEYKGALAKLHTDSGDLLNFEKAKIKETSSTKNKKQFELTVPIGETSKTRLYKGELRFTKNADTWLVHQLELKK